MKKIKYCMIIITSVTENGPVNPALTLSEKAAYKDLKISIPKL